MADEEQVDQIGLVKGGAKGTSALVPLMEGQIHFYDDELQVVLLEIDGQRQVYVPVRQFCVNLGLDWASQYQRMKRDRVLMAEMAAVVITTTAGPGQRSGQQRHPAVCLPLDVLPGWLFTISPTRVNADLQEKIHQYRQRCYRALWEAFLRGELFPEEAALVVPSTPEGVVIPSGDPRIDQLTEQIDFLTAVKTFLEEHRAALIQEVGTVSAGLTMIEAGQQHLIQRADYIAVRTDEINAQLVYVASLLEQLLGRQAVTEGQVARIDERTKRLTPAHARNVQGLVERIVEEHKHRHPRGPELTHMHIYGRLKTRWRAGKFDEIPDERYPEVEAYLREELRKVASGELPEQGLLF
ncbi:MAG TPA: phage antirepressor N-terminal domain-containing protein [Ktedonosporobacter sp.]|nr:phage antirepressor N-terminal domain-containing protein [Ktedonosporobacter sp.]